jgi:hypothetical protein
MTLTEIEAQLVNWGRWARDDDPRLGCAPPAIFAFFCPAHDWDPGWGDPSPPEGIADPIDEPAAMAIDRMILHLTPKHFYRIRQHYYHNHWAKDRAELNESLRALDDLIAHQRERV